MVVVRGTQGSLRFHVNTDDTYTALYGGKATLVHNVAAKTITLTYQSGYQQIFQDFTYAFPFGGVFSKQIEAGGLVTTAAGYNSLGAVTEFQRSKATERPVCPCLSR